MGAALKAHSLRLISQRSLFAVFIRLSTSNFNNGTINDTAMPEHRLKNPEVGNDNKNKSGELVTSQEARPSTGCDSDAIQHAFVAAACANPLDVSATLVALLPAPP